MRPGKTHDVISENVNELIASGHDPKDAVAMALSNSRKYPDISEPEIVPAAEKKDESFTDAMLKQLENENSEAEPLEADSQEKPEVAEIDNPMPEAIKAAIEEKKQRRRTYGKTS